MINWSVPTVSSTHCGQLSLQSCPVDSLDQETPHQRRGDLSCGTGQTTMSMRVRINPMNPNLSNTARV